MTEIPDGSAGPKIPDNKSIADYEDYRHFLKDRFLFLKSQHPTVSYRSLSEKVGTATSYFKHVLAGRKNISLDKAHKVGTAFAMTPHETRYLFYKVIEQTNDCLEVKQEAQEMLASIRNYLKSSST